MSPTRVVTTRAALLRETARGQSERSFQREVVALAHAHGWRTLHQYDSRRTAAGWPDLVLVRPPEPALFIELKTETGRVTPAQQQWLDDLRACGLRAAVWRPRDWDVIEEALR